MSESVGGVGLVVGLDLSIDSGEDVQSEVVLLDGSIGETMVSDVLHEDGLDGLHNCKVLSYYYKNKFDKSV